MLKVMSVGVDLGLLITFIINEEEFSMEKMRKMLKSREGFTLIELLIVIAVLGILAGIAIPRLTGIRENANMAAAKSEVKNFQTALEMYYVDFNEYPTDTGANNSSGLNSLNDQDGDEDTEYMSDENVDSFTSKYDDVTYYSATGDTYEISLTVNGTTLTVTPSGISTTP